MKNTTQMNEMEIRQNKAYKSSLISFSVVLSLLVLGLFEIVRLISQLGFYTT